MAVAEARTMEKGEVGSTTRPQWLENAGGWAPRKLGEFKSFFAEVRAELKKVSWPGRNEVYSTTLVVIATTVFFGFYLYGLDLLLSRVATFVLR